MYEKSPAELTTDGNPVHFIGMKLRGSLEGCIFDTEIEQSFVNPGDTHIEVVYTNPLPYDAVVLNIDVTIGKKDLRGLVVGRKKAIVEYEEAVSDGHAAVMVERDHGGFYTLNLGNLAPKETCVIKIRYAQILSFEQRGLRLQIPTVIAPRYGNPLHEGGLAPHQVPETSLDAYYPFEFSIDIKGALAASRISSPSHRIGISHQVSGPNGLVNVRLVTSASLDRDLVISLDELSVDAVSLLCADFSKADRYTSLTSFCPKLIKQDAKPIAVKFLVDCSGSMAGDSINAAKKALRCIVQKLNKGDRFSLSRFGDSVDHRSRSLWGVKDTTILSAQSWIDDLNANMGGTEMEEALLSTFKIESKGSSDIFLITDGEIFAVDSLLKAASKTGQRVFVVGIGSSPTETTIRRLAEVTGGACDFVTEDESVEPLIYRMFSRLRSPRAEALNVIWPEGSKPLWQSPLPISAFDSDTIHVFATWKKPHLGESVLTATLNGRLDTIELARSESSGSVSHDPLLSRMAAYHRIKGIAPKRAETLAVSYQLISNQTNFLLVHERSEAERAEKMPELVKVRQMLPAGYGGLGSTAIDRAASRKTTEPTLKMMSSYVPPAPKQSIVRNYPGSDAELLSMDLKYLDIPAFLRRSSQDEDASPEIKTPLELSKWLRTRDRSEWPTQYSELEGLRIVIDIVIINWLNNLEDFEDDEPIKAESVLAAFLNYMALDSTYERLVHPAGLLQKAGQALKALTKGSETISTLLFACGDASLERMISSELADLLPLEWPKRIKTMAGNLAA